MEWDSPSINVCDKKQQWQETQTVQTYQPQDGTSSIVLISLQSIQLGQAMLDHMHNYSTVQNAEGVSLEA
jgi:hypothetical protein